MIVRSSLRQHHEIVTTATDTSPSVKQQIKMTASSSSSSSIFDHPLLNGLGGLSHGSFFRVADKVDTSRPPGVAPAKTDGDDSDDTDRDGVATSNDGFFTTCRKIFTGEEFIYSPNLTWFLLAVAVWCFHPYNLGVITEDDSHRYDDRVTAIMRTIFWERFRLNNIVFLTYISFWHVVLYIYPKVCDRPYVPNRQYAISKVIHNLFYTSLGILQWTLTEVAFIYCYKTRRLVYNPIGTVGDGDNDINTSNWNWNSVIGFNNVKYAIAAGILSILLPSWRDVHFYFCHRMIHLRFLYKYIHSLHHRNTDIEPFSGLCMHPCEHLYYYTCYAPIFLLSSPSVAAMAPTLSSTAPFLLFWTGVHVVISPAASHSGYEDHFSADLAHYLHHRYCECNYAAGINFDAYFGTYQATLRTSSRQYSGDERSLKSLSATMVGSETKATTSLSTPLSMPPPPLDPKATLVGWIPEHPSYQICYILTYAVVIADAMPGRHHQSRIIPPIVASIILSCCPVIWALTLSVWCRPSTSSVRKLLLSPFDKESSPSLLLHLGLGFVLGVLPSTVLSYLVLS